MNGKTLDRNSNYFARYCFENGIELYVVYALSWVRQIDRCCRKRVEVIPDEEDEMYVSSLKLSLDVG